MTDARDEKADILAKDILQLAKNTLPVRYRFLQRALGHLDFVKAEKLYLACDARHIYYEPWYVINIYRERQDEIEHRLLHMVMHCVLHHSFVGHDIDTACWDLATDVAVEAAIRKLPGYRPDARRDSGQAELIGLLESEGVILTAERIYGFLSKQGLSAERLAGMREKFFCDRHGLWYGAHEKDAETDRSVDIEELWEDISKRLETELETMNEEKSGALIQNLRSVNRSKHSYTEFLRHFGVHGEVLKLSDEEFDQNYYTYGLDIYGDVPLIEPLEYREDKCIRDFVIVIDTSGSVKGDVVQSFVQHTHDILMQQESFFTRVNIHIIQCDDRVREDVCIHNRLEFDEYLRTMTIKGLGTTDFRPAFEYVDELVRRHEFTDLRGMIYFTDGLGEFPAKRPDYDTAFILHTDSYDPVPVPGWAMHLELTEDEILSGKLA